MSKRNRPVLYEVARRHPHSMRRGKRDDAEPDLTDRLRPAAAPPRPTPDTEPAAAPVRSAPAVAEAAAEVQGAVAWSEQDEASSPERAHSVLAVGPIGASEIPGPGLSLSDRGPLIVAGVATAIVIMFLAFALFQRVAQEPPPAEEPVVAAVGEPGATVEQPGGGESAPAPAPVEEAQAAADARPEPPAPPRVELQRGYDYVFVQYFPPSRQRTAEKVATVLIENGIPAALFLGERDIRLIATEKFLTAQPDAAAARRERERANALIARIKALGKELMPEGYNLAGADLKPIR